MTRELTGQFHFFMSVEPLARWRERKRRQILEAASRIFAERDYHAVSMDQVARRARVGKGTLYRYFDSKEDLFLALLDSALVLLTERLEQEEKAGLSPDQTLSRMVGAIVTTFCQHLPSFRVLNGNEARLWVRKRQLFQSRRRHIVMLLGRVLERGVAAGIFRAVDPTATPSLLIGMIWGAVLNHSEKVPPDALAALIADVFFRGTLGQAGGVR